MRTGQQLWDWTIGGNPIPGMLVADLSDRQRADIIQVLDGMVRERSGGNGPASADGATEHRSRYKIGTHHLTEARGPVRALAALRLTIGRWTTGDDSEQAARNRRRSPRCPTGPRCRDRYVVVRALQLLAHYGCRRNPPKETSCDQR